MKCIFRRADLDSGSRLVDVGDRRIRGTVYVAATVQAGGQFVLGVDRGIIGRFVGGVRLSNNQVAVVSITKSVIVVSKDIVDSFIRRVYRNAEITPKRLNFYAEITMSSSLLTEYFFGREDYQHVHRQEPWNRLHPMGLESELFMSDGGGACSSLPIALFRRDC